MIPYNRHYVDDSDIEAVVHLLRHGWLTQGPMVQAFEDAVKNYVGARFAVAVANGTAGLHIAALAADVGPGTSLVTSTITFVASSNAALYAGGTPIFTDIDPDSINMSPATLAKALAGKTNVKAVVPVHFAGVACDMPAIQKLADAAGAVVIEDAAHALGASYPDGSKVGNCAHSLMTVFSFHPVKSITAGEGGVITTNDEGIYRRLLRLRSHGINKLDDPFMLPQQAVTAAGGSNPWYYEMQEIGFNYRITDIQCALAVSQMKKLDAFIDRRRELALRYDAAFAGMNYLRPIQQSDRDRSGHHLYVVEIDFDAICMDKAALMFALRARGVGSQVHYIPVPMQPVYQQRGFDIADYPNAKAYYDRALSIPLFYDLSVEEQAKVVSAFREIVG